MVLYRHARATGSRGRGHRPYGPWSRRAVAVSAVLAAGLAPLVGCEGRTEGGPLRVTSAFGEPGTNPGQFAYPRGIATAGEHVIIVDKAARVQRLDPTTGRAVAWFVMPEYDLGKPTGLTVGPHPFGEERDVLYIADTHYHRVSVYEMPEALGERPTLIASFGELGDGDGQFVYPTDIALWTDDQGRVERLYVSEYGGHDRVSVFRPVEGEGDGAGGAGGERRFEFEFAFGAFGSGPGAMFNRPQSVAIDHTRREVVVADSCNHRVGRFSPDGELIAWIDGRDTPLDYPYGLEVLADGSYLVCEYGASRVVQIDPDAGTVSDKGEVIAVFGEPGREAGQLANPWGLAVGGARGREAFVLDSRNNRVQAFPSPAARTAWTDAPRADGGDG